MTTKICHMTSVHKRYDGRILKKECVSLANAGYDVTLLVADNKPDEIYCGVKIQSIEFHPKNRMDRIFHSKKHMLEKALKVNADIYHFHDPELIPVGLKLLKQGKKVIYDSHEDYPMDIKGKQWLPLGIAAIIAILFEIYEKYAAKQFTSIITVSPQIVKRFKMYNESSYLITNYPIINKTLLQDQAKEKKEQQICFTGLVASLWMHENVLQAIKDLDVKYVVAGPTNSEYLRSLQKVCNVGQLQYCGSVSHEAAKSIQTKSLAGVALVKPQFNDKVNYGTLGNTKLFEYMQAGIPVICTNSVLWSEIIKKWKCGICVPPDDIPAIEAAIKFCLAHPEDCVRMGNNGKKAVDKEYNWQTQEHVLLSIYQALINQ